MKKKTIFTCTQCGAQYPKWLGRCESCESWNTIIQEDLVENALVHNDQKIDFFNLAQVKDDTKRVSTNIQEFDYVCGGGLVIGSVILISGEPGVGKSTLLLQIAFELAKNNKTIYISGEESIAQIAVRAGRLQLSETNVKFACETDLNKILSSLTGNEKFLIIDSIQTLKYTNTDSSIPGTVQQIKTCSYALVDHAKRHNITIILIGHITKDGMIAGPKLLEHIVDTVLYFEGETTQNYRILRSIKNRYGPSAEVGVFEMHSDGLKCVKNPSLLFLSDKSSSTYGNTVFSAIEGSRPILAQIQALSTKSFFPSPRRNVVGCDINRLYMIIAVLESRCSLSFFDQDIYINIIGGLKITEPACDLALALSLMSARRKKNIDSRVCVFGEIGLTGDIRCVNRMTDRINEAIKLGFKTIICPCNNELHNECKKNRYGDTVEDIKILQINNLQKLMSILDEI